MNRTFFLDTEFPLRDPFRWFLLALLLGIILPLGFDTDLVIQIKHYTLRVNYLAHAFLLLCFLGLGFKSPYPLNYVSFFKRNIELWCFLALGLTGIVSVFSSENFSRSVFFWIWSLGTLLTMKYVVAGLKNRLGIWPLRLLCIYWLAYSGIVIWDFSVCSLGWCFLKVGHVFRDWRPHGWYYEPSYFAGMGLYMIFCFLIWKQRETNLLLSSFASIGFVCSLLGVLCSTSRLGFLGIGLLFFSFLVFFLKDRTPWLRRRGWLFCVLISVLIALAFISSLRRSYLSNLSAKTDSSRSERVAGIKANWAVFKLRPWFGVGPGASGAFFVNHLKDHPYNEFINDRFSPGTRAVMKSMARSGGGSAEQDPLGHSVWLELLSEWGLLGFLFYLVGSLIMLFEIKNPRLIAGCFVILFVNNLLSQTLPRYDLWFALSMLVVFSSSNPNKSAFETTMKSES